jgi:hypothetical protein
MADIMTSRDPELNEIFELRHLVSPGNIVYDFQNLSKFVRDNLDLFADPPEVATHGLQCIGKTLKSWKGWRLIQETEYLSGKEKTPGEIIEASEIIKTISNTVANFRARDAKIFQAFIEDSDIREISDTVGISVKGVHAALQRLRKRVSQNLYVQEAVFGKLPMLTEASIATLAPPKPVLTRSEKSSAVLQEVKITQDVKLLVERWNHYHRDFFKETDDSVSLEKAKIMIKNGMSPSSIIGAAIISWWIKNTGFNEPNYGSKDQFWHSRHMSEKFSQFSFAVGRIINNLRSHTQELGVIWVAAHTNEIMESKNLNALYYLNRINTQCPTQEAYKKHRRDEAVKFGRARLAKYLQND